MFEDEVWPLSDVTPGQWLVPHLTHLGLVSDLIPPSYECVVRVSRQAGWTDPPEDDARPSLWTMRDVLARYTRTPDHCWFTLWDGMPTQLAWDVAPRLSLPGREHLMFDGALRDLASLAASFSLDQTPLEPHIWWPEDRAWVAHWEVDSDALYIGGPAQLGSDEAISEVFWAQEVSLTDAYTIDD